LIAVRALAGGSKYVSGGEMASIQTPGQEFGLRAFAHARRSEEDQTPGVLVYSWNS
jgi:hypothetical protein